MSFKEATVPFLLITVPGVLLLLAIGYGVSLLNPHTHPVIGLIAAGAILGLMAAICWSTLRRR